MGQCASSSCYVRRPRGGSGSLVQPMFWFSRLAVVLVLWSSCGPGSLAQLWSWFSGPGFLVQLWSWFRRSWAITVITVDTDTCVTVGHLGFSVQNRRLAENIFLSSSVSTCTYMCFHLCLPLHLSSPLFLRIYDPEQDKQNTGLASTPLTTLKEKQYFTIMNYCTNNNIFIKK